MEARAAAVAEPLREQEDMLTDAEEAIETGGGWNKQLQEQAPANIKAMTPH